MADEIFTFKVQAEPSGTAAFRTLKAQFGDGYGQMGADGINARTLAYQIKVVGATRVGCGPAIPLGRYGAGGWDAKTSHTREGLCSQGMDDQG